MKKQVNSLLALLGAGLIVFGGMTMANAVDPSPTPGSGETGIGDDGNQAVQVGATAATIAQCNWYLDGVGNETNSLTLLNPNSDKYIGTSLPLVATDSGIKIYMSGSSANESTACSLFADNNGAKLEVTWLGDGFAATSTTGSGFDNTLDWLLSESNLVIDLDYEEANTCDATWTFSQAVLDAAYGGGPPEVPMEMTSTDLLQYDTEDSMALKFLPNCVTSAMYSTSIPAGLVPGYAGEAYTFSGPTVTMTLVLQVP